MSTTHPECWDFLTTALAPYECAPVAVLDLGGRDANGWHTVDELLPCADPFVTLDITPGAGVDIVADAATWQPDREYDIVLSTETLEHAERWRDILATAHTALRPGGLLVCTAATDPRAPHSGIDGWQLRPGEWYANIAPADLCGALVSLGFLDVDAKIHPRGDVYVTAIK